MITFADNTMVPDLKALWKECFGDSDAYIDFYFARRFCPEQTLVWLEHGLAAAQLVMLPATVREGGKWRPVSYIYAVATSGRLRGRGISTRLLEHARDLSRTRGEAFTCLVPAGGDLFQFYEKRGYSPAFQIREAQVTADELKGVKTGGISLMPASPEEYQRLRDERFEREGYVRWNSEALAYAVEENRFGGGFLYQFDFSYGQAACLCYKIENKLILRETTLSDRELPLALRLLMEREDCGTAWMRLDAQSAYGTERAFGMADTRLAGGYLNLVLD